MQTQMQMTTSSPLRSQPSLSPPVSVPLFPRVSVLLSGLLVACASVGVSSFTRGKSRVWLLSALCALCLCLSLAYYLWFRKAIAPRKSSGKKIQRKKDEQEEEQQEEEEQQMTTGEEDEEEEEEEEEEMRVEQQEDDRSSSVDEETDMDVDAASLLSSTETEADPESRYTAWHPDQILVEGEGVSVVSSASPSPSPPHAGPLYFLASTKYISSLSPADFVTLYKQIEWVVFPADIAVYSINTAADDGMYVIVEGRVCMFNSTGEQVCSFSTGELVGEEAVFQSEKRWLTCRTSEKTTLIRMNTKLMKQWRKERPELIVSFTRTSLARQWKMATFCLQQFMGLTPPSLIPVEDNLQRYALPTLSKLFTANPSSAAFLDSMLSQNQRTLSPGQVLFTEGASQQQNLLFIVTSGTVTAHRKDSQSTLTLKDGAVLDAFAFVADCPHLYTVTAVTDTTVTWLSSRHFNPPLAHSSLFSLVITVLNEMKPVLSQFARLGMKREWKKAGEFLFVHHAIATDMYIVAGGRVRVVNERMNQHKKRGPAAGGDRATGPTPVQPDKKDQSTQSTSSSTSSSSSTDPSVAYPASTAAYSSSPDYENFYPVQYGRYDPAKRNLHAVRLDLARGDSVGEVSFLSDLSDAAVKHTMSAVCVRDTELIRISRASWKSIMEEHPSVLNVFTRIVSARLSQLMTLRPGEATQLTALTRKAKCVCIALVPLPTLTRVTSTTTASRPKSSFSSLSSVPAVDIAKIASQLSASLSAHGSTRLVTHDLVNSLLGSDTTQNLSNFYHRSRFTGWLTEQEETHQFLLFQADSTLTPWSQLCVRTADYALIIADSRSSPRVTAFEYRLFWESEETRSKEETQRRQRSMAHMPMNAHRHLPRFTRPSSSPNSPSSSGSSPSSSSSSSFSVSRPSRRVPLSFCVKDLLLLHPADTVLPSGTRHWFRTRPHLHTYHHIRVDLQSHFDRLARYLANKSVGVVFGGGGARGLAHMGVANALKELAVPVDNLGGTSQGSLMAGLFAQLHTHDTQSLQSMAGRVHLMAKQVGSLLTLLSDATFPVMSYFSGKVFSQQIRAIVGEKVRIEDLWVKYFCVSVNVSRADIVVHTSGYLWQACRASMTILEYLPPMQMSRVSTDLLIDGGYINNLPCDVMRELYAPQYVIAVDVENKTDDRLQSLTYFGDSLNGWWLLWLKLKTLLPRVMVSNDHDTNTTTQRQKIPQYSDIISSLIFIQHNRNIRQFMQDAVMDVYIRPQLGSTQLLDYHKEEEIVTIGYRAARAKLTEWKLINTTVPVEILQQQQQQQQQGIDKQETEYTHIHDNTNTAPASLSSSKIIPLVRAQTYVAEMKGGKLVSASSATVPASPLSANGESNRGGAAHPGSLTRALSSLQLK